MGTVVMFPQARQPRETTTRRPKSPAAIVILPVVRIERANELVLRTRTDDAKTSPSRKRRRRAASSLPSPASGGG